MNSMKQNALALALITALSFGATGAALAKTTQSTQDVNQEQTTTQAPQKKAHNGQKQHQTNAGKQASSSTSGKTAKKHPQQPAE